jgi:hypothetical protein
MKRLLCSTSRLVKVDSIDDYFMSSCPTISLSGLCYGTQAVTVESNHTCVACHF